MAEKRVLQFPDGFLWGAATSAYQVEGGNINDWSEWGKNKANKLVEKSKTLWQRWQQEKFPAMFDQDNYICGLACDFYHKYREDFLLAKSLGHNAHRFSIEWSRLVPRKNVFDEQQLQRYQRIVDEIRAQGMEPMVTLWHWPLPLWLRDEGGWLNSKTGGYFNDYVKEIVSRVKGVKFWITLNEPEVYALNSYFRGSWPPQKKNLLAYLRVINNLVSAHRQAYQTIKVINPVAQVGIAKNNIYFEAYQNKIINVGLKKIADWWWNDYLLQKIKKYQDFIGLNYYFYNRINYGLNHNENKQVSDLGWEIYPQGIYYVLKNLKKYQLPIYITENGLADWQDQQRANFIKEHLFWVQQAISEGADVRGYFHWSLLDNFEWSKGFWPRFGLVEVDYKTQERKIRPSALVYADICKNNRIIV